MSTYNRFSSTQVQSLRIQVFTIENQLEANDRIFAENLSKYINLITMLQGDRYNYEETKEHYHNMLLYCVANTELLEKKFNSIRIYLSNIIGDNKTFGNKFIYVEKDEDMLKVENRMIELELI